MADICISCGMPMLKPEDYAMGDVSKDFCLHCTTPDGSMKSYEEVLDGVTGYLVSQEGLDEATAREKAKKAMRDLPAWKDRPSGSRS